MKRFILKLVPLTLLLLVAVPTLFAHADELKPINKKLTENRFGDPGW